LDGVTLKSRFIRLFDVADNKMETMYDMNSLGWRLEVESKIVRMGGRACERVL